MRVIADQQRTVVRSRRQHDRDNISARDVAVMIVPSRIRHGDNFPTSDETRNSRRRRAVD